MIVYAAASTLLLLLSGLGPDGGAGASDGTPEQAAGGGLRCRAHIQPTSRW